MDAKCNTHATSVSTSRKAAGWRQMCKGVSLIFIMFWSSLLGVCVFHAVLLPLLFFRQSHRLYRRMADALVYSWIIFNTVSAILRLLTMSEVQYLVLCIHARTSVLHVHWNCVYMYMSMYSHVCTYVCRNLLGTCRLVYFSVHGRMTHDVCGVTIHTRVGYCSLLLLWQALLELVYGVKVVVTGDCMLPGERSVIIMNHRTRLDWMFFWSVLVRQSGVCTEKIILKSTLKGIPGAGRQHTTCTPVCDIDSPHFQMLFYRDVSVPFPGWAMQVGLFMFIKRRWEQDQLTLRKFIDYFAAIGHRTQVATIFMQKIWFLQFFKEAK